MKLFTAAMAAALALAAGSPVMHQMIFEPTPIPTLVDPTAPTTVEPPTTVAPPTTVTAPSPGPVVVEPAVTPPPAPTPATANPNGNSNPLTGLMEPTPMPPLVVDLPVQVATPAATPVAPVATPVVPVATPAMPTPAMPTPVMPTPAMPTPAMPTPAMPTPAMPTPAMPTPAMPTPAMPTPAMPTPVVPVGVPSMAAAMSVAPRTVMVTPVAPEIVVPTPVVTAMPVPTPVVPTPVVVPSPMMSTSAGPEVVASTPGVNPSPGAELAPNAPFEALPGVSPGAATPAPPVCFPGSATVELASGAFKKMSDVQIGDRVRVAAGKFSEVFMFTHKLSDVAHEFVEISAGGRKLRLTEGHYLYVNGALAAARIAKAGDVVTLAGEPATVSAVRAVTDVGLFNPQTVHGEIVVDGFSASTYTEAVHPGVAHALLTPLRAAFVRLGFASGALERGADMLAQCMPKGSSVF